MYMHICSHTHTHTHTHLYIHLLNLYVYICVCMYTAARLDDNELDALQSF
jgi:hypothetical protein